MKHPDLFKYNGDQDDKTWLYEHHHMPATGGKSYLVILEDIKDLAESEEYRYWLCGNIRFNKTPMQYTCTAIFLAVRMAIFR